MVDAEFSFDATSDNNSTGHTGDPVIEPVLIGSRLNGVLDCIPEKLYFVASHAVLPLFLAQGYIGPFTHRKPYTGDFMSLQPGIIPLFAGPLSYQLFREFSDIDGDILPFALEINTKSVSSDMCTALSVFANNNEEKPLVAFSGCISVTSVSRVITDSQSNKDRLFQARTTATNARYDDLDFDVVPELFCDKNIQPDTVGKALKLMPPIDDSGLSRLDILLDRLSGGLSLCLWLHGIENFTAENFQVVRSIFESTLEYEFEKSKDLKQFFCEMYEKALCCTTKHQNASDSQLFSEMCNSLIEISWEDCDEPVDGRVFLEDVMGSIGLSVSITDKEKEDIQKLLANVTDYKRGVKMFQGDVAVDRLRYPSIIPFLLAVLSDTNVGLSDFISRIPPSESGISETDYVIACFLLGMMAGRRGALLQIRNNNFDVSMSDFVSDILSRYIVPDVHLERRRLGVLRITSDDSKQSCVSWNVGIDGIKVYEKEYPLIVPSLKTLMAVSSSDEEGIEKARLYLCERFCWEDCIETIVEFAQNRFISHSNIARNKSQLILKGTPSIRYQVNQEAFLKKLELEEENIDADVVFNVMEILQLPI